MYNVALKFHWTCSAIAGLLAFMFLVKLFVARKIAFDELSTPTTAAPAGLICMTMDIVFAGRGLPGMCVVLASSFIHLCLAVWFIYITLVHHMMPDPSWFPNTVGIGMSAVKTWLYFPAAGHVLMAVSHSCNCFLYHRTCSHFLVPQVSLCLNIFFFPIR
jgi:tellurite resistance protein TehA-like permease